MRKCLQQNIPKSITSRYNTIFRLYVLYLKHAHRRKPIKLKCQSRTWVPIKSVLEDLPKTSTLHAVVFVLSNCLHPQGTVFQTPLGSLVETAAQHSLACSAVNRRASPKWGSNT